MRRWSLALALAAALVFPLASFGDDVAADGSGDEGSLAGGASADEEAAAEEDAEPDEEESGVEEAEEEDEEPTAFDEYLISVKERYLTGLNGLLTAPADPPMAAVDPPKALEGARYARHPLGFGSGVLLMGYRVLTGAVDFGLAPLPKLPVLSPVPRYKLIPGFEHEDE
jgi:hypothetical protein